MNSAGKSFHAVIVYNDTPDSNPEDDDYLSEAAVKDEAEAVKEALKRAGYNPRLLPIREFEAAVKEIQADRPDIIFNLCEGYKGNAGYEKNIAALWELTGIPFTGNSSLTLGIAQNKVLSKKLFESENILTPPYEVFNSVPEKTSLSFPLIAKPSREDASLGIRSNSLIRNLDELKSNVRTILEKYKQPVLVEEFIDGREFNISVIGSSDDPKALPVSEIDFSELGADIPKITSYEAKWLEEHPLYKKTPAVCPAKISDKLKSELQDIARRVFKVLEAKDYGRVDVRLSADNKIYVLEFNPNPDISPVAGFIRSIKASGMTYEDFVEFLIKQNIGEKVCI